MGADVRKYEVIDSRELEDYSKELDTDIEIAEEDGDQEEVDRLRKEQAEIEALAEEIPEWSYGEQLIHEDYFKDYAQELASDIGSINEDAGWPSNCIDWDEAADQLKMDYTTVDYDGETYYVRYG